MTMRTESNNAIKILPKTAKTRKSKRQYRSELAPEYFTVNKEAKLKPLGRWIGMTYEAKKALKREARKIYAAAPAIPVMESPVKNAKQARTSRIARAGHISAFNNRRDMLTGNRLSAPIPSTGYLGVELRAIRRERGVGRPVTA